MIAEDQEGSNDTSKVRSPLPKLQIKLDFGYHTGDTGFTSDGVREEEGWGAGSVGNYP